MRNGPSRREPLGRSKDYKDGRPRLAPQYASKYRRPCRHGQSKRDDGSISRLITMAYESHLPYVCTRTYLGYTVRTEYCTLPYGIVLFVFCRGGHNSRTLSYQDEVSAHSFRLYRILFTSTVAMHLDNGHSIFGQFLHRVLRYDIHCPLTSL